MTAVGGYTGRANSFIADLAGGCWVFLDSRCLIGEFIEIAGGEEERRRSGNLGSASARAEKYQRADGT